MTRQELEAELKILDAERNAQYWTFTRCARGKPVDPKLTRRIYDILKLLEGIPHDQI